MLEAPVAPMARSSLEEMLDSIRRRDEQPKDQPPALPQRPVKKGRLPSSRRSLPVNFKVGSGLEGDISDVEKQMEKVDQDRSSEIKEVGFRSGIFGSKRLKIDLQEDSPYDRLPQGETFQEKIQEEDALESVATPATPMVPSAEFGWDGDAEFALKKKLRVWCWISNVKWELGKIQSVLGEEAHVSLSDGRSLTVPTENLLPANPDILDGVEDLIQLSYLNEPSVLYNLEYRYSRDSIYTKAGPVLVAINPFKKVPFYGNNTIQAYRHKLMDGPHVYAIADNAFNEMMRDEVNQSIIISGESGAGKTETAKVAMQYLAALGGGSGIEYEVLQTNFILEAFGNARTLRNDNSSRFGKLIEIHFSAVGKICGANIQTFLLEKSRVVQRAMGERSYHIFYQLCAGAPPPLRENLNLKTAKDYEYLKQSDCLMIDGTDDAQSFNVLMAALDIVQIHKEEQEKAFAMIAAVLWLGNISFLVIDNENHVDVPLDEGVTSAAKLLGCNAQDLILALSTRKIQAGKENIIRRLTLSQAIDTRDALAKSIYASLFDWLVERINRSLGVGKIYTGRIISILDIYGFESFQKNSFEQFCINYANERLQQHFNRHLFKLEQEEYAQDGIDWTKVDFVDNTECLNLFEKKPLGLLSLLDEESTFPKATDLTLANKLKQHLNSSPCFKEERGGAFRVCHYAGEVRYDTSGFLEKNRDPLHSESIQLLFSSTCEFPKLFASTIVEKSQKHPSPLRLSNVDSQKLSVGTKFKDQLFRLMQRLENTTPHFIRCIKPNSKQFPGMYEHNLVLQQLRCCGVLEVVRISRSGYPTRLTHQQFAQRYGFLCSETIASQDPLSVSVAILQHFSVLPDMYQVGYTKLFFRTGQIASLEDSRNRTLQGILGVQKSFRGLQARHCFQQLKRGSTSLQSFIRGELARNEFELLSKRWKAALHLQKYVKRQIVQRGFVDWKRAAVHVQSAIRGLLSRKQFVFMQELEILKPKHVKYNKKLANGLPKDKGQDSSEEHPQVHPSVLAELQRRVLKAEAALRQKEVENTMLLQQVHRYETRWSEYETKMKSMEETWQKQMTALQMSLAAARKSIAADDTPQQNGKSDLSTPLYYDSEDTMSLGTRTPDDTPSKQPPHPYDGGLGRVSDGGHHAVNHILKEFEQRKQVFEDDARFLVEVKSAQSGINMNPDDELRKLKLRFTIWKKDYKVRLRETKITLHKLGNSEAEKLRKNWWGKRIPRLS